MKDIQGLVKLMPFESFDELQERSSKELLSDKRKAIYDLIKKNDYHSVDELIADLDVKTNKKALRKTLKRLKSQLINKLFFIDIGHRSSTQNQRKKILGYKKFAAVKIIEQWDENMAFITIAKELITYARRNQMTEIVLLLAERMEYYYSFIEYNEKLANTYTQLYDESLEEIRVRRDVSNYYYKFVQMFIGGKQVYSKTFLDGYKENIKRLIQIQKANPTDFISNRVFSTLWFYYILRQEYEKMIEVCDEALAFYSKTQTIERLFIFELRKGVSLLYLQDYEGARTYLRGLEKFDPTPGMLTWNSAKTYQFMLEMVLKEYQSAANILVDVVTDKALNNLSAMWVQQWTIRSAYIHFLAKIGHVNLETFGKKRVPNFRLGKFLNEVPLYSKDKRGLNISIIIAQFLILLADRKYDHIADRIDALNKYSYRHLKNDYKLRSNCFIRMLLILPRANFNPIRATRYAERYVDRLKTTKLNFNEYSNEIEIIPYEDLWEIVMGLLSQRQNRVQI